MRHKQVYHTIDEFPAMLSYRVKPEGFQDSELLEFNVKKHGLVWQTQEVNADAESGKYREIFVKPDSSRKRKVSAAVGAVSDIVEGVSGDIGVDGPMDLSGPSTAGGSLANNAVPVKEADAAMSSDVVSVAPVGLLMDSEKLNNYHTINMLELRVDQKQSDVDAVKRLLVKKDLRIAELERKNAETDKLGRAKFDKLHQISKQQLDNIASVNNYWKDQFMRKFAEDVAQNRAYEAVMQYGYSQGEGLHKGYNDLSNINFDDFQC